MISVLIADDDRIILEGIVNQIDWNGLGYEVVGLAGNGAQALSLMREKRPDLVIVDVVMSLMNGMEVIAAAKAEGLEARMLMISSYEEFDYVKQAITLGVIGYVLKSELFGTQFTEKLEAIRQEISREWENRRNSERGLLERFFSDTSDTVGGSGFLSANGLAESVYAVRDDFALFYEWAPIDLNVLIYESDEKIVIEVSDDGKGIDAEKLNRLNRGEGAPPNETHTNIVFDNLRQRLRYIYDGNFELTVCSVLQQGTTITIVLPTETVELCQNS